MDARTADPRPPDSHRQPQDAAAAAFGLTKTYGSGDTAVPALRDVTVHFGRGTFTAVMGPSGSGKSSERVIHSARRECIAERSEAIA